MPATDTDPPGETADEMTSENPARSALSHDAGMSERVREFDWGATMLGAWLANMFNSIILFMIPPLLVFGAALFVTIKYRRFGYTAGVIIAPFIIVTALVVLLLLICGRGFH